MLIDSHCHLDFDSYAPDRDEVIARAAAQQVTRIINPATDAATGRAALKLAETYAGVYVAVGIHPNSTEAYQPADLVEIEAQSQHTKVVAIGEIGLDYYRDHSPQAQQWQAFEAQLALAARRELPVIIHNRDAHADVIAILTQWVTTLPASLRDRPGVLHSFSAPRETAEAALALGFCLGFTGPITFKNADDLRAIAASIPLDRLLVETDGPFLTPHPYRGKRNEPAYVVYMAERLALLHNVPSEVMAATTTQNAERLFRLPTT